MIAFDVNIVVSAAIPADKLNRFIERHGLRNSAAYTIDDWEFAGKAALPFQAFENLNAILQGDKIICLENGESERRAGLYLYKNGEGRYCYYFWADSKLYPALTRTNCAEREKVYDRVCREIENLIEPESLILCGMGLETLMDDCGPIDDIIGQSAGIARWMVPLGCNISLPEYREETGDKYKTYTLAERGAE